MIRQCLILDADESTIYEKAKVVCRVKEIKSRLRPFVCKHHQSRSKTHHFQISNLPLHTQKNSDGKIISVALKKFDYLERGLREEKRELVSLPSNHIYFLGLVRLSSTMSSVRLLGFSMG